MKNLLPLLLLGLLAVSVTVQADAAKPVRLIFDTDIQGDADDVGAVAVLHALADRGEVQILATGVSCKNPWSPLCLDVLNTYYGRPQVPIGIVKEIPVANHHGDLCFHDGKVYVAVNLGKFNDPAGNADSWVYVYNADDLSLLAKHETQEVFHGAGGIGFCDGHFLVIGGLPDTVDENYVYEYDSDFKFVKKHVIASGHTHLGIQTAAYADDQ